MVSLRGELNSVLERGAWTCVGPGVNISGPGSRQGRQEGVQLPALCHQTRIDDGPEGGQLTSRVAEKRITGKPKAGARPLRGGVDVREQALDGGLQAALVGQQALGLDLLFGGEMLQLKAQRRHLPLDLGGASDVLCVHVAVSANVGVRQSPNGVDLLLDTVEPLQPVAPHHRTTGVDGGMAMVYMCANEEAVRAHCVAVIKAIESAPLAGVLGARGIRTFGGLNCCHRHRGLL